MALKVDRISFSNLVEKCKVLPGDDAWRSYCKNIKKCLPPGSQDPLDFIISIGDLSDRNIKPEFRDWLTTSIYKDHENVKVLLKYFGVHAIEVPEQPLLRVPQAAGSTVIGLVNLFESCLKLYPWNMSVQYFTDAVWNLFTSFCSKNSNIIATHPNDLHFLADLVRFSFAHSSKVHQLLGLLKNLTLNPNLALLEDFKMNEENRYETERLEFLVRFLTNPFETKKTLHYTLLTLNGLKRTYLLYEPFPRLEILGKEIQLPGENEIYREHFQRYGMQSDHLSELHFIIYKTKGWLSFASELNRQTYLKLSATSLYSVLKLEPADLDCSRPSEVTTLKVKDVPTSFTWIFDPQMREINIRPYDTERSEYRSSFHIFGLNTSSWNPENLWEDNYLLLIPKLAERSPEIFHSARKFAERQDLSPFLNLLDPKPRSAPGTSVEDSICSFKSQQEPPTFVFPTTQRIFTERLPGGGRLTVGNPQEMKKPTPELPILALPPDHEDLRLPLPQIANILSLASEGFEIDLLLMVVTQVEFFAVLRHFTPLSGYVSVLRGTENHDTYILGLFGVYRCALVQCDMGGSGAVGSALVADRAISFWRPKAVIMIGVGFGLQPMKQQYGDVLVCQQLANYDLQRVTGDAQKVNHRDVIQPAGSHLLGHFLPTSVFDWSFAGRKVWRGQLLSGQVLIDSKPFAEALLSAYPEAIGGEMEGHGLSSAAVAKGTQWMIVKGICDFAGLVGSKTKEAQPLAAAAATSLVLHVLRQHILGPVCSHPLSLSSSSSSSFYQPLPFISSDLLPYRKTILCLCFHFDLRSAFREFVSELKRNPFYDVKDYEIDDLSSAEKYLASYVAASQAQIIYLLSDQSNPSEVCCKPSKGCSWFLSYQLLNKVLLSHAVEVMIVEAGASLPLLKQLHHEGRVKLVVGTLCDIAPPSQSLQLFTSSLLSQASSNFRNTVNISEAFQINHVLEYSRIAQGAASKRGKPNRAPYDGNYWVVYPEASLAVPPPLLPTLLSHPAGSGGLSVIVLIISRATKEDGFDKGLPAINTTEIISQLSTLQGYQGFNVHHFIDQDWKISKLRITHHKPDIIHFICHGQDQVGLHWMKGRMVTQKNILSLIKTLDTVCLSPPKMILITACESAWMIPQNPDQHWIASPIKLKATDSLQYSRNFYRKLIETRDPLLADAEARNAIQSPQDQPPKLVFVKGTKDFSSSH